MHIAAQQSKILFDRCGQMCANAIAGP